MCLFCLTGIKNDFGFRDDLSPGINDTLCEEEIHFPPYNAPELQAILEERVAGALYDDAVETAVVALCVAIAAQDTGIPDGRWICCTNPVRSREQTTTIG